MAIDLNKLHCTVNETFLSLVQHAGSDRYDIVRVCVGCGTGKIIATPTETQLANVTQTRDALAQAINALAGLSMNCAIPEKLRQTISSIAENLDKHLDKIDGCDKF
jgi:hypothetical protein